MHHKNQQLKNDPVFLQSQQQRIEKKFVETIRMRREITNDWVDSKIRIISVMGRLRT